MSALDERTAELWDAAVQHHEAGDLLEAEQACRNLLRIHPDNAMALNLYGVLAYRTGRIERSRKLLSLAVSRAPENVDFRLNHADALRAMGRHAAAARELRECLEIEPENGELRVRVSSVLEAAETGGGTPGLITLRI